MIRPGELRDLPVLTAWGEQFYALTGLEEPYDKELMELFLVTLIKEHVCFVVEVDGKLAGSIGGSLVSFNSNIMAQESFWWIDEVYRKYGLGRILLNTFSEWAKQAGATSVVMVHLSGTPSLGKWYIKEGFRALETMYVKPC